jgi:hypothetical protein
MNRTTRRIAAAGATILAGITLGMVTHTAPSTAMPAHAASLPEDIGSAVCIEKIDGVILECGTVIRYVPETTTTTGPAVTGWQDDPRPVVVTPQEQPSVAPNPTMVYHEDPAPVHTVNDPIQEGCAR